MIELKQDDILTADAEALVNTVNCVGVMGRGIALQFRKAFPDNYQAYKAACHRNALSPGKLFIHRLDRLNNPRFIINFPTKRHWRGKSRIKDIASGLDTLVREVRARHIRSIAMPPLGCGLGGLDWNEVRPLIERAFNDLPHVRVLLYEPTGAPAPDRMVKEKKTPHMTVGRAALIGLIRRYLMAVMDPFVSLLEIHKLMYFMQQAGENLRLRYAKGPYGPYAENLRHVLSLIEGHFITGFGDAQDKPDTQIELRPGASERAQRFLHDHPQTCEHFDKVVHLIEGFETPFGLELLATVHWVAAHESASTLDLAIQKTYAWNPRKKMFSRDHIHTSWLLLSQKGWLPES